MQDNIQKQPTQPIMARLRNYRNLLLQLYSSPGIVERLLGGIVITTLGLGMVSRAFASPNFTNNASQDLCYEPTPFGFYQLSVDLRKKPSIFSKKEDKKSPSKIHPRKKLLEEAPIHTQKAWLYSAIIPGLGQLYNKSYWEIPVIYGVFGLLAWGAIYNHDEYITSKRELLDKCKPRKDEKTGNIIRDNESQYPNLVNYMDGRKRDRTIFVASMFVWYLLNVFEAYVGGTLKTFDVSDDLEVVIQPHDNSSTPQNTSIGLSISLQSKNKDEDRTHWVW